jgi:hypothetical protein
LRMKGCIRSSRFSIAQGAATTGEGRNELFTPRQR